MSPVFFPLPNVPFIWKHSGVPYSDWQCSSNSSIKLPCHMSRLVWLCVWVQTEFWLAAGLMGSPHGWNSCTLKSWVVGHMLSLLIHQLTATMITVEMGGGGWGGGGGGGWRRGFSKKKKKGKKEESKVGRRAVIWPGTSNPCKPTSQDLQVLKWKWCDFVLTCMHKHNMLDSLSHTYIQARRYCMYK